MGEVIGALGRYIYIEINHNVFVALFAYTSLHEDPDHGRCENFQLKLQRFPAFYPCVCRHSQRTFVRPVSIVNPQVLEEAHGGTAPSLRCLLVIFVLLNQVRHLPYKSFQIRKFVWNHIQVEPINNPSPKHSRIKW